MKLQTRAILLAAVLATPVVMFTSPRTASAQNRIDNSGANDANNRIGSSGANTPTNNTSATNFNTGNVVAAGTVTGGREFRGRSLPAPGQVLTPTVGGLSDRFVRQSSSAYSNNAQTVRPFYGVGSYGAPPPAGFTQSTTTPGTYVQAQPLMRGPGDLRVGDVTNTPITQLPRPGELTLPGQVDASNTQSLLTASPLYGIRQDDGSTLSDGSSFLNRYTNYNRNNVQGADDKSIQNMRDELRKNIVNDNPNDPASQTIPDPSDLSAKSKFDKPFESPDNSGFDNKALTSTLTGTPFGSKITSDQTMTNSLVEASSQTPVLADLSKRYQKLQGPPPTDQQINAKFQNDQVKRAAEAKAAAGGKTAGGKPAPRPGGEPGFRPQAPGGTQGEIPAVPGNTGPATPPIDNSVKPPTTPEPAAPSVEHKTDAGEKGPSIDTNSPLVKPGQPLVVTTLTEGMKAGGLKDTLSTAEGQMRQGKYTSALDQYDLAERVAPNNPMITLGRAHAELGATYYARADADIRRALAADGSLMLGQFRLDQFLGRERLDFLEKDLKDITTTEPKSVRAPFLLAYLKYNAGDKKMASNYLALSEKRAGVADPLYKQLRTYWDLPAADPIPDTPDLNK